MSNGAGGDPWTPLEAETLKTLQKELIRGKVTLSLYAEESSPKGAAHSTGLQFQVLDEVWADWQRWLASKNQDPTNSVDLAQAWVHLATRHPLLYKNALQNNTDLFASSAEPDQATVAAFREALQEALALCKEFRFLEGQDRVCCFGIPWRNSRHPRPYPYQRIQKTSHRSSKNRVLSQRMEKQPNP